MSSSNRETIVAAITAGLAIVGWFATSLLESADPTKVFFSGIYLAAGIGYGLATFRKPKYMVLDAIMTSAMVIGAVFLLVPTIKEAIDVRTRSDLACVTIEQQLFVLHPVKDNAADTFSALKCRLHFDRDYLAPMKEQAKELSTELEEKRKLLKEQTKR